MPITRTATAPSPLLVPNVRDGAPGAVASLRMVTGMLDPLRSDSGKLSAENTERVTEAGGYAKFAAALLKGDQMRDNDALVPMLESAVVQSLERAAAGDRPIQAITEAHAAAKAALSALTIFRTPGQPG